MNTLDNSAQNSFRSIVRYPDRMTREQLLPCAYYYMYLARKLEERIVELYRNRLVKGTVTLSTGNEATAVGMALPLRPGQDVVSFLHRNLPSHLISGLSLHKILCQYIANAESPSHGREGNVHHGNAFERRFPMMSHLGSMLSLVVGGTWAARQGGEDVVGVTVIGDGGTSTGDFHESINLAAVRNVPVLFLIENNHYAYSTPTRYQYRCERLSDRAAGYGIQGKNIDGTDVWEVYSSVLEAIDTMREQGLPYILECRTLRLMGHAVYDKAEYVTEPERKEWATREPLVKTRNQLLSIGVMEQSIALIEQTVQQEIDSVCDKAISVPRPSPHSPGWEVFAPRKTAKVEPFQQKNAKNLGAINAALHYVMEKNPRAFLAGLDIGPYGSAFKSCKGLHAAHGDDRVLDMPLCESSITGFALGASQTGGLPIVEFQFADFSTEATTQIGLNCGTWYFRSGSPAPILFRLPCGGGITLGAFHSGEFEGLWSRFPGLKIIYPSTPQECFEAIVAGFYDPNPCIVLEHKLLYGSQSGDIDFDGDLESVWRSRCYGEGSDLTVIATGAMVKLAREAAAESRCSAEVWNPFILSPLAFDPILSSVRKTGRLLVIQESGATAGMGDRFVSLVTRACMSHLKHAPILISSPDVPVPFARELEEHYLPSKEKVCRAMQELMGVNP